MANNSQYDRALTRQYPGLFVILLDQSISMKEIEEGSKQSKAQIVTRHVNTIIQKMIDFAGVDEYTGRRKNYAYLCVLGYNDQVYPLLSATTTPMDLPSVDEATKGLVPVVRQARDASGTVIRNIREKIPFWIEPRAEGNTDIALAFEEAENVVRNWLRSSPEFISSELGMQMQRNKSFPPVVINITDAKHNGESDPRRVADRIRQMGTENGNVLICNCHFTHEKTEPCVFPKDIREVEHLSGSRLAERMFSMSSPIPEELRKRAEHIMRQPVHPGARSFVYNADPDILLKFLRWTTLGNPAGSKGKGYR